MAFSSYRGIVGHITTMMDYAQIHIFDACGHYKGRLLLILILHNVMHDITSTLPVDVAPSARFTQNGRSMSIAGGRQEWFGYYWLCFNQPVSVRPMNVQKINKTHFYAPHPGGSSVPGGGVGGQHFKSAGNFTNCRENR